MTPHPSLGHARCLTPDPRYQCTLLTSEGLGSGLKFRIILNKHYDNPNTRVHIGLYTLLYFSLVSCILSNAHQRNIHVYHDKEIFLISY